MDEPQPYECEGLAEDTGAWRYAAFRSLGFDVAASIQLTQSQADWHEAEHLIRKSCPHDLAADILL